MTKNDIRILQKNRRDQMSINEQRKNSKAIWQQLFESEVYHNCKLIFTYVSFRSEVGTHEMIRRALVDGKKVYAPKVEERCMEFYSIKSLEELVPGMMGILEPEINPQNRYSTSLSQVNQEDNIMLLPGLAFDTRGNRIGYGAGYYDRYLSREGESNFTKIAISYDFQVMEQITSDEYDIKTDMIITPTRWVNCSAE